MWWFQKVDLMLDFFGAFFNLCGLKLGESEIYMSPRSPLDYLFPVVVLNQTNFEVINTTITSFWQFYYLVNELLVILFMKILSLSTYYYYYY